MKVEQTKNDLFVTCAQGLEPLLEQELNEMGFTQITLGYRGVYVAYTSPEQIYRINYCSRIAGRVLLPLARFRCRDRSALTKGLASIDWLRYIPNNKTFAIDANVSHKELRNSLFAAQLMKDCICDQFRERTGSRPNVDLKDPDVQLNLFIHNELAVVSYDTSRTPLYKRGYRQESVEAPMQESLAAALLKLAKYQGTEVVCDPLCGSGTLLIEAALIATRTAPGYLRQKWGFMLLPNFSQTEWLKVKNEADSQRIPLPKNLLFGADINKSAVHTCKINIRAAGFHQSIEVTQSDFRDYIPPVKPTLLISNPPYGQRLDDVEHLKPLYRSLGDFMKHQMEKPSRGFIFTGNLELTKEVGLAAKRRYVVENSGIDCRLLEYDLY
jgi:putative N6-adenine-specific DNA methylase